MQANKKKEGEEREERKRKEWNYCERRDERIEVQRKKLKEMKLLIKKYCVLIVFLGSLC